MNRQASHLKNETVHHGLLTGTTVQAVTNTPHAICIMKLFIAIAIISVIAVAGSRFTYLDRRLPLGFRNILLTGSEYVLIGILLGSVGFNILDVPTRNMMEPFLIFCLSWIGFLFGVQFEIRFMKRLPHGYFTITAIQSGIVFLFITTLTYAVCRLIPGACRMTSAVTATVLGATGACTAQSAIAIVNRNFRVKNRELLDLLRYISSVDGLFAMIFLSLALCISAGLQEGGFSVLTAGIWLISAAFCGIVPAVVLILLSRVKFNQQEYLVFLVGTIMFCGGLARHLEQSPLISGLICGMLVANFCQHRLRATEIVVHAEKSIYIILLLFLGAGWQLEFGPGLILAAAYIVARFLGKTAGVWLALRLFQTRFSTPSGLGMGLVAEGGVAVAIILDFCMLQSGMSFPLGSIVIISLFVNEAISPRLILAQFKEVEKT